jgi:hypothetical protein
MLNYRPTAQDGYTLERVDVYGLVDDDGTREAIVIPGAECYIGRNDNPSFSCVLCLSLLSLSLSFSLTSLPSLN